MVIVNDNMESSAQLPTVNHQLPSRTKIQINEIYLYMTPDPMMRWKQHVKMEQIKKIC